MSTETKPHMPATLLTTEEVSRLLDEHFPGAQGTGRAITILSVGDKFARLRLTPVPKSIRPGGTISGPAMFTLADMAIYVALIATKGAIAIPAVTSNLNINFLARPEPKNMIAEARVIRLGRRLAFAEVEMAMEDAREIVAHATGTYAMPTEK